MSVCDINGKQIGSIGGAVSGTKSKFSKPNRIVCENAKLSNKAVEAFDGNNISEYYFPAGSVFWFGETGDSGVYWLYPKQIDFAVGDSVPSGSINNGYRGSTFLLGCARYASDYVTCNETDTVLTAVTDLYLYVPDSVLIVREPTEDFLALYGSYGTNLHLQSGFIMWGDEYEGSPSGSHTKKEMLDTNEAYVENSEHFRAIDRTIHDKELYVYMMGDSIVHGVSNAGTSCYRIIVPAHFNAPNGYLTTAGSCVTTGYGIAWGDAQGYAGFSAKLDELDDATCKLYNLVVYGMGSNDWGNAAPLGSITDTDDTTFYGALRMTYDKLMEKFPNAAFIVMIPIKRENWNTKNDAGYYLVQYCQAIYEVLNLRKYRHFYALDLFDKWFLNWDDETMRSHWFLDYAHPSANAHVCIAKCLEDKISEVMAIEGINKIAPTE